MTVGELTLTGPVGVRRFTADATCRAFEGHEHNYDHATVIVKGRVSISRRVVVHGETIDAGTTEHGVGDVVAIPAKMRHTIAALDDDTQYLCIFSHRDFDGLVTEVYTGNPAAYL